MTPNIYTEFANSLYQEDPRAAWELEAMKYGIMARIGLDEKGALELAVKIVTTEPMPKGHRERKEPSRRKGNAKPVYFSLTV